MTDTEPLAEAVEDPVASTELIAESDASPVPDDQPAAEVIVVVEEVLVEDRRGPRAVRAFVGTRRRRLEFRERIAAVQAQFAVAATEALGQAEVIVTDAIAAVNQALLTASAGLGSWRESDEADPAELNAALNSYREYLNRVLSI